MAGAWRETEVPGLFRTTRLPLVDERGRLSKILGEGDSQDAEPLCIRELFWSVSNTGVFRGLHFQTAPRATRKLVFVAGGAVRDFVVDLRRGSPTFKTVWEVELDPDSGGLVIPVGCAHGFEVLHGPALMVYGQDEHFRDASDSGIHFESVGIQLRHHDPIVSSRDRTLPSFDVFDSPFEFA